MNKQMLDGIDKTLFDQREMVEWDAASAVRDLAVVVGGYRAELATLGDGLFRMLHGIQGDISFLVNRKRNDFSKGTKKTVIHYMRTHNIFLCPCCDKVEVIAGAGERLPGSEFDHMIGGPSDNTVENCWLVCASCNRKLKKNRIEYIEHIAYFRKRLCQWMGRGTGGNVVRLHQPSLFDMTETPCM